MRLLLGFAIACVSAVAGFFIFDALRPGTLITIRNQEPSSEERITERVRKAKDRSRSVKGVYMTAAVANDAGNAGTHLRNSIVALIDETELNAVVIDAKETTDGLIITDRLQTLIAELNQKGIWVIARLVVFKDDSHERDHPEWYLKRKNGAIWRDNRGGSWLDPASRDVWNYQRASAVSAIAAGFDEIQFDYIRFPSDGNLADLVYPVYDGKRPKYEVLREFFAHLHEGLKRERAEIILSADLFGYVAIQQADLGIGQRLADIGANFDYISLMVYPSHYYAGFQVDADPVRGLPALFYPYQSSNKALAASSHPYEIVHRSLLIAEDALSGRATTTASAAVAGATSSPAADAAPNSALERARLRPWLQDFDLRADTSRGIVYDAAKVRAQIDATEAAGSSGWLLWNPANVYTREALKAE